MNGVERPRRSGEGASNSGSEIFWSAVAFTAKRKRTRMCSPFPRARSPHATAGRLTLRVMRGAVVDTGKRVGLDALSRFMRTY